MFYSQSENYSSKDDNIYCLLVKKDTSVNIKSKINPISYYLSWVGIFFLNFILDLFGANKLMKYRGILNAWSINLSQELPSCMLEPACTSSPELMTEFSGILRACYIDDVSGLTLAMVALFTLRKVANVKSRCHFSPSGCQTHTSMSLSKTKCLPKLLGEANFSFKLKYQTCFFW